MDKIIIKNLAARGILGLNDWERKIPQEILINIVAYTDIRQSGVTDDVQYSVDYWTLAKKVQAHAETAERLTVEALATDIARIGLEDPNVKKIMVRIEKPGAVQFADSVGVEIERKKEDFE